MARKYKDKSLHDKNLVKKSDFFNPPYPPLKGEGFSPDLRPLPLRGGGENTTTYGIYIQ